MKDIKNKKPRYNMWQNSAYMLATAWTSNTKSVIWLCLAIAALGVASSVLGLFIAPRILGAVEAGVPLGELVRIILVFSGAMLLTDSTIRYLRSNAPYGRIFVRSVILSRVDTKMGTTSYPNTENQDVRKMMERSIKATNSNDTPTEDIWRVLTEILKNIAGFVIYLVLLASLPLWVLALVLGTTVTGFFISRYLNGWGYRHRDEEAEYGRPMSYISTKSIDTTLAKDIRLFGMKDWMEDIFNSAFRLYKAFVARGERVYIWANIVDVVLNFLRNGVAYIYLISRVLDGDLAASQFLLYFMAVSGFTAWVSGILGGFNELHIQSLEISNIREFLEYPEPFAFEDGIPLPPQNQPYELELRNVSFRYYGKDSDTLSNINLLIKPGEKLAIVGLNGAGKTTLVKLVCGLYDPTEGEILLNGENIKKYNRRDYYQHFSAVFQDFSLISTSVLENITQSVKDGDLDKAKAAATKAGISQKIESLSKGYNTPLGKEVYEDGINFSGGEQQRLMLARALYKNAPIIILDEPTAAMDPIAESDMYNKYHELTGGRTSLYISHRLASTRFCDRVIYIENGIIAEEGTHEALIQTNGRYAELFEIQSHYYKEGA